MTSINDLPSDILLHICSFVPLQTIICSLPLTSQHFQNFTSTLPKYFFKTYLNSHIPMSPSYSAIITNLKKTRKVNYKHLCLTLLMNKETFPLNISQLDCISYFNSVDDLIGENLPDWVVTKMAQIFTVYLDEMTRLMFYQINRVKVLRLHYPERYWRERPRVSALRALAWANHHGMLFELAKKILVVCWGVMNECYLVISESPEFTEESYSRLGVQIKMEDISVSREWNIEVQRICNSERRLSYMDMYSDDSFDIYTGTESFSSLEDLEDFYPQDYSSNSFDLLEDNLIIPDDNEIYFNSSIDSDQTNTVLELDEFLTSKLQNDFEIFKTTLLDHISIFNSTEEEEIRDWLDSVDQNLRPPLQTLEREVPEDITIEPLGIRLPMIISPIPGMEYYPNFCLESTVSTWGSHDFGHYSLKIYGYDFVENRKSDLQLPHQLQMMKNRVSYIAGVDFTEVLVTNYHKACRVNPHKDKKIFGPVIATVTIKGNSVLNFHATDQDMEVTWSCYEIFPNSLYIMKDEATSSYAHGLTILEPRISVSFRTLADDLQ